MATSGTISSTMTARQLCQAAAEDLGAYGAGETLTSEDGSAMLLRLNFMLKSWQANGVNLWREAEDSVTFPIDTATVTLDPFVIDVLEARLVDSTTFLRPLQRWEVGEYKSLPNPNQPGWPMAFYLRKFAETVTMTVWPVPQQAMEVRYTYARVIEDVTDLNQTVDVPQQWLETVWKNLAVRCANIFGASRLDPGALQLLTTQAEALEQAMLDSDRPASVFMGNVYGRYF